MKLGYILFLQLTVGVIVSLFGFVNFRLTRRSIVEYEKEMSAIERDLEKLGFNLLPTDDCVPPGSDLAMLATEIARTRIYLYDCKMEKKKAILFLVFGLCFIASAIVILVWKNFF